MNIWGEHRQNLLDRSLCLLKDPAVGHGQGSRARARSALLPSPSNLQPGTVIIPPRKNEGLFPGITTLLSSQEDVKKGRRRVG